MRLTSVVLCSISAVLVLWIGGGCRSNSATTACSFSASDKQGMDLNAAVRLQAEQDQYLNDVLRQALLGETESARAAAFLADAERGPAGLSTTLAAIRAAQNIVISNLRNAETIGFKATRSTMDADGKKVLTHFDMEQGSLENTNRPLDVAIEGQGFFRIRVKTGDSDAFAYTRNGNFFLNRDGFLVVGMGDGYELTPRIVLPVNATDISISQDGRLEYARPGQSLRIQAGRIKLFRFSRPDALKCFGGSIYVRAMESGEAIEGNPGENGLGTLLQSFLEGSNVDPVRERLCLMRLKQWHDAVVHAIALMPGPLAGGNVEKRDR
jgi:flagellar basal body rod protein FlgG